jgi:aspartyl-tRNA synthetase
MAFVGSEEVMSVTGALVKELWEYFIPGSTDHSPFPRITYHDAMLRVVAIELR